MNDQTIKAIIDELVPALVGRSMGKVFQLSRLALAIDFRTRDGRYLLLGLEPQPGPRLYLIARRVRDLEKQSVPPGAFTMTLYKRLSNARLVAIEKDTEDRIVRFAFESTDVAGKPLRHTLIAQLTGRTATLVLVDETGYVIDSLRAARSKDHEGATRYEQPAASRSRASVEPALKQGEHPSLSEAADAFYQQLEIERDFNSRLSVVRSRLKKEIGRRLKLREHLQSDLEEHGDADTHKRLGELLMANVGTAERHGENVTVIDYYTEGTPHVELKIDKNTSLQDEAAKYFERYSKARRAAGEIARRLKEIDIELQSLEARKEEFERVVAERDEAAISHVFAEAEDKQPAARSVKSADKDVVSTRRYLSSDGFEILVGRGARDNDQLTFRVARPQDLWLHAADYPGSHVIVRNPTRKEIPHRTVIEAAQLAAKFSKARREGKVDVHYTQRKFLAKPKGAAPGLVRMSSFRTIIVEPRDSIKRI